MYESYSMTHTLYSLYYIVYVTMSLCYIVYVTMSLKVTSTKRSRFACVLTYCFFPSNFKRKPWSPDLICYLKISAPNAMLKTKPKPTIKKSSWNQQLLQFLEAWMKQLHQPNWKNVNLMDLKDFQAKVLVSDFLMIFDQKNKLVLSFRVDGKQH